MNIKELATVDNAKKYLKATDKFVFCFELLGDIYSIDQRGVYEMVNVLEDLFDEIIEAEL